MYPITKSTLPLFIHNALTEAGIDINDFPNLPLRILVSGAIELDDNPMMKLPTDHLEMVVVGMSGKQGIRASSRHINVFALSGSLIATAASSLSLNSLLGALLALLTACSINLSPEQSAFFLAVRSLNKDDTFTTADEVAKTMGAILEKPDYSVQSVLSVVDQLQSLGVKINVGDPPNQIITHSETHVQLPLL